MNEELFTLDKKHIIDVMLKYQGKEKDREVAEKLGMAPSNLSKIYSGERTLTIEQAARFSVAYGVSMDELIGINEARKDEYSSPSPRLLMLAINYLNRCGFMHFDTCRVLSRESPFYLQDEYEGEEVTSIVPDLEYLKNMIDVYKYLCDMPDINLKEKIVNDWINNLPGSPIESLGDSMSEN